MGARVVWGVLSLSFLAAGLQAQDAPDRLPVKRVVLFKNGVGYFEHLGTVRDRQDVGIAFTSGQLNDVLKSLTVLDLNGGRIAGVGYGSSAPIDRQLGDLRLPVSEKTSLTEFLAALRGAKVEIRNGTTVIAGRLLSVERKTRMGGGATLEVDYVALLTDHGEVKTTEVSPSFSVRLLDAGLATRVGRYLDVASASREADVRRMVISTDGAGERSLFVSYISEVPVWKATYRIVLNPKTAKSPLLQGWAIVDNTVGQDWEKVELSLVAGAPQSFIQNLAQPYYARRPVVPLPESANRAPQTYESTLIFGGARIAGTVTDPAGVAVAGATVKAFDASGTLVGQAITSASGTYELSASSEGPVNMEVSLAGFSRAVLNDVAVSSARLTQRDVRLKLGSVSQAIQVTAEQLPLQTESASISPNGRSLGTGAALGKTVYNKTAAPPPPVPTPSSVLMAARGRAETAARAQELGDLFEYKLKEPITILKNHSALVPIVQSSIGAEKVSVWNEQSGAARPQRALWINNSSGLTLDGGSFSVLEDETFAGEGVFEPIRPGEKRLVSYATDLALNTSSRIGSDQQRVTRVRVANGTMIHESELREKKTYTFRNEDSQPRTIIVEHPARSGYELRGDAQPSEITSGWMRFRLNVEPKQTASLMVEEARPLQVSYKVDSISKDQIAVFLSQRSIDRNVEEALRKVLAQKELVGGVSSQKSDRESEQEKIFDDQQRLRENMKSLKGSAEERTLLQRYTKQLNDQEDRLEALRKEIARLDALEDTEQDKLNQMIRDLSVDIKL